MIRNQSEPVSFVYRNDNIFLTSTFGRDQNKRGQRGQKINGQINERQGNEIQILNLQKNIIEIVLQFKSLPNSLQLTHQFNQILYSLDTQLINKKTVSSIISTLKEQTNLIKLNRLYNRLKALKKELSKVKPQKLQQKTFKKAFSSEGFRKYPIQSQSNSFICQTLPNQNKQNQEWKQKIQDQISYKQRLQKIQSQSHKHSLNKQNLMKKKLQKVKEMNKKSSEIYEKNKKLHKQRINKYKYQQLFDPNQINENMKRRAEMMNLQAKQQEQQSYTSQIDIVSDEFLTQPINNNNLRNELVKNQIINSSYLKNVSKKDLRFDQKAIQKSIKQDIFTFKTLNDLTNSNMKQSKSFKSIKRQNIFSSHKNLNNKNANQCTTIKKSFSFDKSFNKHIIMNSSKKDQEKLNLIKKNKQNIEDQKFNKMITQVIEKQKKILRIYKKRNFQSKTKKNSPKHSLSKQDLTQSFDLFPQKRPFKKIIVTKKELMDKQRTIFAKIQSKIQKKDQFLQERVNKIRQRLQRQEETKEKYKQYWNEYISLTESASVFQSQKQSPKKIVSKDKQHQKVIKNLFLSKLKKSENRLKQKKLADLSLDQLKRKLISIKNQEKKTPQQNLCF